MILAMVECWSYSKVGFWTLRRTIKIKTRKQKHEENVEITNLESLLFLTRDLQLLLREISQLFT